MNLLLINLLRDLAANKCNADNADFDPLNYGEGNYNDIYDMGVNDGEVKLARQLLEMLENGQL